MFCISGAGFKRRHPSGPLAGYTDCANRSSLKYLSIDLYRGRSDSDSITARLNENTGQTTDALLVTDEASSVTAVAMSVTKKRCK